MGRHGDDCKASSEPVGGVVSRADLTAAVLVIATIAYTAPGWSQAPQAAAPTSEPSADVTKQVVETEVDIHQEIQDQIDKTCPRYERADRTLNSAIAAVATRPDNRDWVKARSLAFDEALLKAQQEYISSQGIKITGEIAQSIFKAGSDAPPPFDASSLKKPDGADQLVRKLVALGVGRIDKELTELGIDPKTYEKEPESQRYVTFRNALRKKTLVTSFGSIVGMVPVETFEGQDGKGQYYIGVCVVTSQVMKDLAVQVQTAHGDISPDPTKAQDLTALYKDKQQLFRDFGIRRLYDKSGYPVLISFYQWGSSYLGTDPEMREEYQSAAMDTARLNAYNQLAMFLHGSGALQNQSEVGKVVEDAVSRHPDGYVEKPEPIREILDASLKTMTVRATVDISGTRDLYKWRGKHPLTGQNVVGVILMWSPVYEQQVRALKNNRPAASAKHPDSTGPSGVTSGRSLMNPDDF